MLALLVVVLGCGLAAVAGYFAARQYGWLGQEAPPAVLPSRTAASPTGAEPTLPLLATTPALAATQTRFLLVQTTVRPTLELIDTATRTAPVSEVATPGKTALAPAVAGVVLFEDTFDGSLSQYWLTWGEPRATIGAGFGDRWLDLKAIDHPGQAGVTTRSVIIISNTAGVAIEFEVQMDGRYPRAVLVLDWDPTTFDRGPENQEAGLVRLEIQTDQLKLYGRATRETCLHAITATAGHTYLLSLVEGQGSALYLDGAGQPACRIADLAIEPQPGKLSFSGLGWVSRVKVMLPE